MSDSVAGQAPLWVLPNETLEQIFAALDPRSLGAALCSCRRLRSVGERVVERRRRAGVLMRVRWTAPLDGASLCPFEGLLAVGGHGAIHLLDSDGREVRTIDQQHWSRTCCMAEFDAGLAVGWNDESVRVLNRDGRLSMELHRHSRASMISLATIGDLLASGWMDGTIVLWDARGKRVKVFPSRHSTVTSLVAFDDPLASGSWDKSVERHHSAVTSLLAFDGLLASGSWDKTVKLWDVASGACVRTLSGHTDWVTCLAAFAGHLVSGSGDKTIRWWTRSGECAKVFGAHSSEICSLASSEELLFSASWTEIAVWSVEGELLRTISSAPPFYPTVLCFWRGALVVARDDTVTMW
jgi:WD40 repeat protein